MPQLGKTSFYRRSHPASHFWTASNRKQGEGLGARLGSRYTIKALRYVCVHLLLNLFPSVYEIRLGTVDQTDVDVEWRLRPYMNTARKRFALSTDHT